MAQQADTSQELSTSWADPGYFAQQSRLRNFLRLLKQLWFQPKGHKTLPTKSGIVLILLALGIGSAAYNTSSNILFIVLALLLSSLLLSGLLSWLNFKGTKWRLFLERHFRVGEIVPVGIEITNDKSFLPTLSLWFYLKAHTAQTSRRLPLEEPVEAKQSVQLQWLFEPVRRGRETIEIVGLESSYPFGFLQKTIGHSLKKDTLVWPKKIPYQWQPPCLARARSDGKAVNSAGTGYELINLREYRPGDPLRTIHWKASARLQRFLIREVAEENHESYLLVVETPATLWRQDHQFERLCSTVASLAEDLFRREQLWGYIVNDSPLATVKKQSDLHSLFDILALLQPIQLRTSACQRYGATTITFHPGAGEHISIYVGGIQAGSA